MIRHNWQWKLVALILSFFLWFYVNTQRNPKASHTFNVPIQIMNLAKGYIADVAVGDATVRIEGYKALVDTVRQNDISAWVDLDSITATEGPVTKTKKLNVRVSGVPPEEINTYVTPKNVQVQIEMVGGKKLPVEVKFLSAPPLGYAFGNYVVSPATVAISGKNEKVSRVNKVVLAVSENWVSSSIDQEFPLVPMDEKGNWVKGVTVSPQNVRLQLVLVEVPTTQKVMISYKLQGKPKYPAQITNVTVNPSSVTLEGRPNQLAGIKTIETEPIDVEAQEQSFTRQVNLRTPNNTKVRGPDQVTVTVEIENVKP